ncbi:MAG: hypothetical protein Q9219_002148, partial [cf. Caloplaca sp. 3 TL-2023]
RKGLGDQAQEKLTPDSQKSTTEQGTEKVTSLTDKAAGSLQPGDSKSTTQELGDKSRSGFDTTQNTAKSYADQASNAASDATSKISENMPSGGAQDTGKTYLDQATEAASNAAKYVSDTVSDVANKISESGSGQSK